MNATRTTGMLRKTDLGRGITRLIAPNPSPMTLEGTNTYIVKQSDGTAIVVDPGPDIPEHRARIVDNAGPITLILTTHSHDDHAGGVHALAVQTGARVVEAENVCTAAENKEWPRNIGVLALPGHTDDSVGFLVGESLLCGDLMLGEGTSAVDDLAAYLDSLSRVDDLVVAGTMGRILPGHGNVIDDPRERIRAYRAHRIERIDEVRRARESGIVGVDDIVGFLYPGLPNEVRPAARRMVVLALQVLDGRDRVSE
ncbi:MBL fold metallo-hydrolase [Arcanobacterium haemolyticum]|nr:MBL fold metallo-hydrolase [Arcanobacterium haemolyticum]